MTTPHLNTTDNRPTYDELLEGLEMLTFSMCPRKSVPVLEAAGYSVDVWKAAYRHARKLITKARQ